MLGRFTCFIVVLLIAIVSQAAPSSKYTMIVTFADGHASKYALNNQPKLLWEDDSVYISSGIIRLGVVYNALHSITFTQDSAGENGDVNGDGTTDTQDVLHIYDYMKNGTSQYDEQALDVNGDRYIDTQDVLLVYDAMRVAAKRRAIPSKTSSSGIDQMVVVTSEGDLFAFNLSDAPTLVRDNETDSLTLKTQTETLAFLPFGIKQIYFEDKATVDADPYIAPKETDYINPNFVNPEEVTYQVMKLDTAICKARLKFTNKIPQMYVGQIYALVTDSIAFSAYLLTADNVSEYEVDIRYRPASIAEILYDCEINVTSDPENNYFRTVEIKRRVGEQPRGKWKVDPIENLEAVKGMKDLYNIFKNTECDFGVEFGFDFGIDMRIETGKVDTDKNRLREIAAKLKYFSIVYRGKSTVTNKVKFKFEFQKDWSKDIDVRRDFFSKHQVIMAGWVPIWLTYSADLCAMLKAAIDVKAMFAQSVTEGFEVAVGVEYDVASGKLSPIGDFKHIYKVDEPVVDAQTGGVALRAWPYIRFNVYLYHVLGIHVDLMPYIQYTFEGLILHETPYHQHKLELGLNWRAALFVEYPWLNAKSGQLEAKRSDIVSYMSRDIGNVMMWHYPDVLINVDSIKAVWVGFDAENHLRFDAWRSLTLTEETGAGRTEVKGPMNKGTEAAVEQQCFSDFPWLLAAETPLDNSYLDEMNQVIDVGGNMNMIKARMPENIRKRMPNFPASKARYDLAAQLPKPTKAPLRMALRRQEPEVETGIGGMAEGLFKVGEPWGTQCDDNSQADTRIVWPTPIGYKNVLRTSILDGKGKPVMSIDREMPWEIKNFDATWTGSEGGHGTINYRNGGENITEVVVGADGSVKFIYNRSSGKTTVIAAGMSATLPQRMLPGTSCMGSPDITVPGNETFSFKGFCSAWDMMYWQAENLERNPYAGQATFGTKEYLGYPCKYITTSDGTVYFWQNLCLCATGEATFKVTSLTILDEIDNPTVTVRHDEEE